MNSYSLEFVLYAQNMSAEVIKNSLTELGGELSVLQLPKNDAEKGENFKINIRTEDPTIIFDTCAQLGRIKSVKIDETTI